ncbi:SHOCT domain-containing protein [Prescottella soli]
MVFWSTVWDAIWWILTIFVCVVFLMALFSILGDLFRDRNLSGWYKALWLLFLIFLPFITVLVYLVARGNGMAERAQKETNEARVTVDEYILRSVAGGTAAAQIAQAKQLLDDGAITDEEFQQLKDAVLSSTTA